MRTLSRSTRSRTSVLVSERSRGADLLLATLELLTELLEDVGLDLALASLTVGLADDREGLAERTGRDGGDGVVDVVLVLGEDRELLDRLRGVRGEVGLRLAELLDDALGGIEATGDDLLRGCLDAALDEVPGGFGGLGLDHHDRDVVARDAAGDDHVEDGVLELAVRRERDPLTLDEGDAGGADRAGERQAGDLRRRGGGVDGQHVVGGVGVEGHAP